METSFNGENNKIGSENQSGVIGACFSTKPDVNRNIEMFFIRRKLKKIKLLPKITFRNLTLPEEKLITIIKTQYFQ